MQHSLHHFLTRLLPDFSTGRHHLNHLAALAFCLLSTSAFSADLVITGVVDGPLSGGVPKAIELCVLNDIADLSDYGVGSANNGGGSDGEEFTFPAGPASAGTFLYVASEAAGFSSFFGFAPNFISGAASINGDDAIELFQFGAVVDIYGDINVDGSGQLWEYTDGWAYRDDGTGPDGTVFVPANWAYSGPNALDGETTNDTAAVPFPTGAYSSCELPVPVPDLLLSEIVVTPTNGEFIEILNPTGTSINLSDVYLTDATFAGGGVFYYNIVTGTNAGGGGFGDFHARFPDGATIAPGEFQTVSLAGSDAFFATFGIDPTYELYEDAVSADGIPDMREALPGSINNQGGLSNGGEVVILYTWDGASDLVQDIDYGLWGDAAEAVDKTGVAIDGPDADAVASVYLADTAIALQDVVSGGSHASGDSFQRVDFTEGVETQSGGNGLTGSDETSEDLSVTWAIAAATPGEAPAADWVINEILADPATDLAGDANGDGVRDSSDDEFVEVVNISGAAVDISGWTLSDGFSVRHTFPAGTVIPNQCGIVVFGGGTPTGRFGNVAVQTASSGALGLNNGGDSIAFNDGSDDVATASYGSEGGDNQSLTLDPDITGSLPWVKHSAASGSGGALFSPGTRIDAANFGGCPSSWVINEILADPASGLAGDANGDGVRDFSDDEFVEIVNDSDEAIDVSGWTLADAVGVRHTFPSGSIVNSGCSVVVFGGGTPTGIFGNSVIQTASGGSLGFNNGGDSVTLNNGSGDVVTTTYGSEGGDNQSLTLDPDVIGFEPRVKHSVANGSGGNLFSPGTKIDGSQFDGCPIAAEIFEIQGSGASSPMEGNIVLAEDNIVTVLGTDGFFMQTPDARDDADVDTSNGIFVFTGGLPGVAIGDQVDVTGTVNEFFGFTEIEFGSTVSIDNSGNALPAITVFDETVPSPDPIAPSCAIEFECYEGMLVQITGGTVTGPNQRFGSDPIAEVHITAAGSRTFREPGIEFPGLDGYPEWDGNPEVFEMDPDKLGLPNQIIPAGSTFDATGAIGYEFGDYELWPSELTVTPAPLPVAVRAREVAEMTVGALNLFRLFDDVDDPEMPRIDPNTEIEYLPPTNDMVLATDEYMRRLAKFSAYIRTVLMAPDILAVSEVESLVVLQDLADKIKADDASLDYTPYLEEGNDVGSIDVGFLVLDTVEMDAVTQLGRWEILQVPGYEDSLLNDRPPLLFEGRQVADGSDFPVAVIAIHSRSLGGIDGNEADRVQAKRLAQAQFVAQQVQDLQTANPDINLVVAGDFNAFEFSDSYVDVTGQMKGEIVPGDNVLSGPDLVDPNLLDQVLMIDSGERYSFNFRGNAQTLDHALTSSGLDELVRDFQFGRGNSDAAFDLINDDSTLLRSSDHDGLVLFLVKDSDGDGVTDDADYCPGTVIPEAAPMIELRTNNFALEDDDRIFDTKDPNGVGPEASFDIFDTAGCSCEQIVAEQGLGKGHLKFGCSLGEMEEWVEWVNLP